MTDEDGTRAHDLIRLTDPAVLLTGTEPDWVARSLLTTPWVVVRRAEAPPGHLPVGVRGTARHERHAARIPLRAAARTVRPEELRPGDGTDRTPALAALRQIGPLLDELGLPWGPVGSVGFERATGRPVTTAASDLDLIVRTETLPTPAWAAGLHNRLSDLPARVDCQIEMPAGAVALAELAAGPAQLLLRTRNGPRLTTYRQEHAPTVPPADRRPHRDPQSVPERP
ncbi:malonate decarboxylase holo-ACP synthase [Streptomyces xylophagus]|uniref:malonate decarboxylase holo-ACP synthase n=1 Tax=Streptomyces xylophagus TaxID=285514 RepID=UPI00068AD93A|nr:malonate decarboxylase holo-ACP synthase [Streptomyces xylophagus]